MSTENIQAFEISAVTAFMQKVLQSLGLPEADAQCIVDVLMDCELRGYADHGIGFLNRIAPRFKDGHFNVNPEIRVLKDGPAITLLDGDQGCGVIPATRAMEFCITKARQCGISAAGVTNSGNLLATAPMSCRRRMPE